MTAKEDQIFAAIKETVDCTAEESRTNVLMFERSDTVVLGRGVCIHEMVRLPYSHLRPIFSLLRENLMVLNTMDGCARVQDVFDGDGYGGHHAMFSFRFKTVPEGLDRDQLEHALSRIMVEEIDLNKIRPSQNPAKCYKPAHGGYPDTDGILD